MISSPEDFINIDMQDSHFNTGENYDDFSTLLGNVSDFLVSNKNKGKEQFVCEICQIQAFGAKNFEGHLQGLKHKKNLKKHQLSEQTNDQNSVPNAIQSNNTIHYEQLKQINTLINHLNTSAGSNEIQENKNNNQNYTDFENITNETTEISNFNSGISIPTEKIKKKKKKEEKVCEKFDCNLCVLSIKGEKQLKIHVDGIKHRKKINRFCSGGFVANEDMIELTSGVSDAPDHIAKLNYLVGLSKSENIILQEKDINISMQIENGGEYESFTEPQPVKKGSKKKSKKKIGVIDKTYYCKYCSLTIISKKNYLVHKTGIKHLKKIRQLHAEGVIFDDPVEEADSENIDDKPEINEIESCEPIEIVAVEMLDVSDEILSKIIGLEFVKKSVNSSGVLVNYICELCNISNIRSQSIIISHLTGKKHKSNYKTKFEPKIIMKTASKKEKFQALRKDEKEEFWMKQEKFMEQQSILDDSELSSFEKYVLHQKSFDDRYLLKVHNEIKPDISELSNISSFASFCQQVIKQVSEQPCFQENPQGMQADDIKTSILRGMMRVGNLASKLNLKNECIYSMVILTSIKPTVSLLQTIYQLIPEQIMLITDSEVIPQDIRMYIDVENCRLILSKGYYTINLYLTSPIINPYSPISQEEPDPEDILNKEICLKSLMYLRRSKWFQIRAGSLKKAQFVMRILKHLKKINVAWSYINDWAIEQLVEKCAYLEGKWANLGDIFRRYLEILSSGILFLECGGIIDPCEKLPCNIFDPLTNEQAEKVTILAQECLRKLAFRRIHEIFGVTKYEKVFNKFGVKRIMQGVDGTGFDPSNKLLDKEGGDDDLDILIDDTEVDYKTPEKKPKLELMHIE